MLREIRKVRQNPGEPIRRWFQDPNGFDLLVWEDNKLNPIGFQLSLDRQVITYRNHLFSFSISSGERVGTRPASELLLNLGKTIRFDKETKAINKFKEDSKLIDLAIRHYVFEKLKSLLDEKGGVQDEKNSSIY